METNVKFDHMGYTLIADGLVLSPGHVEGVEIFVEGMELSELPLADLKALKEEARERLICEVYEGELTFD